MKGEGVLKEWGDRFYYPSSQPRQGRNIRGGALFTNKGSSSTTVNQAAIRHKFILTIGKAPEVMIKISGGGKNMQHILAHFDYISRQGELELEDENGLLYQGQDELQIAGALWAKGKIALPLSGAKRREAINLVLSMPAGTNRIGVANAAREFAASQFIDHQYVFAHHQDEAHPHVHLIVKMTNAQGVRLNPRKRDLQQWREHFATKLREEGIAANATPRLARGLVRESKKVSTLLIEQRANQPPNAIAKPLPEKDAQLLPTALNNSAETQKAIMLLYAKTAHDLANSPKSEDKQLAIEVIKFIQAMPQLEILQSSQKEKTQVFSQLDKQK